MILLKMDSRASRESARGLDLLAVVHLFYREAATRLEVCLAVLT